MDILLDPGLLAIFIGHDEYGRLLKKLGAIDPEEDLFEEGSATSALCGCTSQPVITINSDQLRKEVYCSMILRLIISIGILFMSIAQLLLAVAIYMRD